jgi:CBS domain-containing protein
MKVRDVMTPNPRTVGPNDTLKATAEVMRDEDTGIVPVVDGERLAGVITDRDITVRAVSFGFGPQEPVRGYMTTRVVRVTPDMTTREAAEIMEYHQVRRLPVFEHDKLVGILSLGDIAVKEGRDKRSGEILERISEGVKHVA